VAIITEHRMIDLMEMSPRLVPAPCVEFELYETEPGFRVPAYLFRYHASAQRDVGRFGFNSVSGRAFQRVGHPTGVFRVAADDREVSFGRGSISELEGEITCGIPRERDDHDTGGHAIQSVHDIDWPLELMFHHRLDVWGMSIHAVHVREHCRRFVDDDDLFVLVKYLNGAVALGGVWFACHGPTLAVAVQWDNLFRISDPNRSIVLGMSIYTGRLGAWSAGIVCALIVALSVPLAADDGVQPEPIPFDEFSSCPDLPPDAVPISYRVIAVRAGTRGDSVRKPRLDEPGDEDPFASVAVFDGMLIDSEANYQEALGAASVDMDWEASRIVVVEEFVSYKFGELDSDIRLSGVYESGDSIIISQTGTNYRPCQGIAQDPSWFSFDMTYLLLVLPRRPEHIAYHFCRVGGCPPDIP